MINNATLLVLPRLLARVWPGSLGLSQLNMLLKTMLSWYSWIKLSISP